jgi:hypothetical protein
MKDCRGIGENIIGKDNRELVRKRNEWILGIEQKFRYDFLGRRSL